MEADIEKLKERCLEGMDKARQLEDAAKLSGDVQTQFYQLGRKQVWVTIHNVLVRGH